MLFRSNGRKPRWYIIPARVLFVTFLVTLMAFAVLLLLAIAGMVIVAKVHGASPDLRFAYRGIALPAAIVAGSIVLGLSVAMEIRHYRHSKALAGITRASR
jgi:peptidoglycan/LPS O-acetylase OafA/YrhL